MSPTTEAAVMDATTLSRLFEFTYNVTQQNIDGFDHEDSLVQPERAGNCLMINQA